MTVGYAMLIHKGLPRAAQIARHLASAGYPVVIHVDAAVPEVDYLRLKSHLRLQDNVRFCERQACEWGTWSIVEATRAAARLLLDEFPEVGHVFLASGACMPLRPPGHLAQFLAAHPDTDFIESVSASDVPWISGGLQRERFEFFFPVPWRKRRRLFDRLVRVQKKLGVKRRPPLGLKPFIGSQWWCLTRGTLEAIFSDPDVPRLDRYFRRAWIPDESYFQTLARRHARHLESRSLTLSRFDGAGRPHVFYDDHLELLRQSDCFVARKVWHKADRLYQHFLTPGASPSSEPDPSRIDRLFLGAAETRRRGRRGLIMQSRYPGYSFEAGRSAAPYQVFQGFQPLLPNFRPWLARVEGAEVHGRLFAPEGAEFATGQMVYRGGLSAAAATRDANPEAFLTSLLWHGRGSRQAFSFAPEDPAEIWEFMVYDTHAQIAMVTGTWALELLQRRLPLEDALTLGAKLQARERRQIDMARSQWIKAQIRIWSLADFLNAPMQILQTILDDQTPARGAFEAPEIVDLSELPEFLQTLRNAGMNPYLAGRLYEFPEQLEATKSPAPVSGARS
ncbi:MAG: beta-1,6-N-acetylglucosaminyltransferase [Pseudomonadota bacterium]